MFTANYVEFYCFRGGHFICISLTVFNSSICGTCSVLVLNTSPSLNFEIFIEFYCFRGGQPHFCPPLFRRKAEGHSIWNSVLPSLLPSFRISLRPPKAVGTLCAQLLQQFYADSFKTSQMLLAWSDDMH